MKPNLLLWGSLITVRNYFAIAFNCVYLTLTVGVAHTTHYCMGREISSSYFSFSSNRCECPWMVDEKGCCEDQIELVTLEGDESTQPVVTLTEVQDSLIGTIFDVSLSEPRLVSGREANISRPQTLTRTPLYLRHHSLVLYEHC